MRGGEGGNRNGHSSFGWCGNEGYPPADTWDIYLLAIFDAIQGCTNGCFHSPVIR